MAGDRRFQAGFGANWYLLPTKGMSWREWVFDPFFGVTRIGQAIANPRAQLPDIQWFVDEVGEGRDPETGMKNWHWISRCFWLRFGVRVLGVDIGFSMWYRRARP